MLGRLMDLQNKITKMPRPTPSVLVVILNWNGLPDTLECLQSLKNDVYSNKHILVIDNHSLEDPTPIIQQRFPNVEVDRCRENWGFTGGNNRGFSRAIEDHYDYVYILNNDTTSNTDAIEKLVFASQGDNAFGIVSPLMKYYDSPDESWFSGSRVNLARAEAVHDSSFASNPSQEIQALPWTTACAMLIPIPVLKKVGGFDDRFFLNWEDVDLCFRVISAGWKVGICRSAVIYHKVGRTFAANPWGMGAYYHIRNRLLFLSIHGGCQRFSGYYYSVKEVAGQTYRAIKTKTNAAAAFNAALKAHFDFLFRRFGCRRT